MKIENTLKKLTEDIFKIIHFITCVFIITTIVVYSLSTINIMFM